MMISNFIYCCCLYIGIFGPSKGGVYSESLQATVYDAACIVLENISEVNNNYNNYCI
jgi:hypothetical protein